MVRPAMRLAQSLRARRLQFQQARFASTNPSAEAAQKKAQDALASAQKYAGQAVEQGKKFLGPFGEKLANVFGGTCTTRSRARPLAHLLPSLFLTRYLRVSLHKSSRCGLLSHSLPPAHRIQPHRRT